MAKKTDEEREYHALIENVRGILKTRQGKDILWYVLELCDIYGTHFTGNSQTFFNEGRRSVGIDILSLIGDADPTAYANLLLDQQKKKDGKNE